MNLLNVITKIHSLLNATIPIIVSLGIVYFVWGVVSYVIADAEEAKKGGRDRIVYGIIGLAVVTSVWAIVNLVARSLGIGSASAPSVSGTSACGANIFADFSTLVDFIGCTINSILIPFLFAVALVVFVWGIINFFIISSDEEAKRTQGKQFMIWGLISLTVMLCVWGLVTILGSTFGINTKIIPELNSRRSSTTTTTITTTTTNTNTPITGGGSPTGSNCDVGCDYDYTTSP